MFTGLVEAVGVVRGARTLLGMRELLIESPFDPQTLPHGASVAVQGVCLTLTHPGGKDGRFRVEAGPETVRRSTLGSLRRGDGVHLERALRLGDRLGGHIVQGHVDGVGELLRSRRRGGAWILEIGLASRWMRYVAEKGSIAIDGVSLTIAACGRRSLTVQVIRATAEATLLAAYRPGRRVNIEVDIMAKYAESILRSGTTDSVEESE